MKSFFRNLSSRFPFFASRPSALERAVRQSPKSRRLRMEPLENRALLAVDAFGGAASLVGSDVGESWGSDPAPAFSASELSTDAAETTISLAALNSVPYGPYVTSEQAALIALRSNATLADETLADFGVLWDETDETSETTLAETATDGETLNVVAEALTFEPLDLGEIEQEPGDASVMSGQTATSGGKIQVTFSGGMDNSFSGGLSFGTDKVFYEGNDLKVYFSGPAKTSVTVVCNNNGTASPLTFDLSKGGIGYTYPFDSNTVYDGARIYTFSFTASNSEDYTLSKSGVTVAVLDAPEFVTGVAEEGANNKTVNDDSYTRGICTYNTTNGASIYVPGYNHTAPVNFSWNVSGGTATCPFELNPTSGQITYCANQSQYGTVDATIKMKYTGAPELYDNLSVTLKWADIEQAKRNLLAQRKEAVSLIAGSINPSCQNISAIIFNKFKQFIAGNDAEAQNAKAAIASISHEYGVNSPKCQGLGQHTAIKVTFIDGSYLHYDYSGVF